jgi:hypothetical protein
MKVDVQYYVKVIKEHEEKRLSTNERQRFWEEYRKQQRKLDEETSFNMSRFG